MDSDSHVGAREEDSRDLLLLEPWASNADNTLTSFLVPDSSPDTLQHTTRDVTGSHYVPVKPERVLSPYLVAASASCAQSLGLAPSEIFTDKFLNAFVGNGLLPGLDVSYATAYTVSINGDLVYPDGSKGDGRAVALGEVLNNDMERWELQLKGSGRSPFSRGADGRAVLRSCIREYLASEAMHHLGVLTTRALSVIGTGQSVVRVSPFGEEKVNGEAGAVMCRVSKSFIRVGQFELFYARKDYHNLIRLADYACFREYPNILDIEAEELGKLPVPRRIRGSIEGGSQLEAIFRGPSVRYVRLLREVAKSTSRLIAQWLRVGYTQGNMNSDNILLGGRTMDYGPFGWMEEFDPTYQPWRGSGDHFAFKNQPIAMQASLRQLSVAIQMIIEHLLPESEDAVYKAQLKAEVEDITEVEYMQYFQHEYDEVRRCKLGLLNFSELKEEDARLWRDLEDLLQRLRMDYTIFFRELSLIVAEGRIDQSPSTIAAAVERISVCVLFMNAREVFDAIINILSAMQSGKAVAGTLISSSLGHLVPTLIKSLNNMTAKELWSELKYQLDTYPIALRKSLQMETQQIAKLSHMRTLSLPTLVIVQVEEMLQRSKERKQKLNNNLKIISDSSPIIGALIFSHLQTKVESMSSEAIREEITRREKDKGLETSRIDDKVDKAGLVQYLLDLIEDSPMLFSEILSERDINVLVSHLESINSDVAGAENKVTDVTCDRSSSAISVEIVALNGTLLSVKYNDSTRQSSETTEMGLKISNTEPLLADWLQRSVPKHNTPRFVVKIRWKPYHKFSFFSRLSIEESSSSAPVNWQTERASLMLRANPKYILRNWMAVRAYEAANSGDFSLVQELEQLFRNPYDEQPDMQGKWYQKTPFGDEISKRNS